MTGPREKVYDSEIAPLMSQIIQICKDNQIPVLASFELDETEESNGPGDPLMCSTILTEGMNSDRLREAVYAIRPQVFSLTETRIEKPDGTVEVRIKPV